MRPAKLPLALWYSSSELLKSSPAWSCEPGQAGDGGRVVGDGRGLRGAGGESPGLADGAATVLEEPEARGGGQARPGEEDEQAQQDDAWLAHGDGLSPIYKEWG